MPDVISGNLVPEIAAQKDAIGAVLGVPAISTTAALTDKTNAINTTSKYQGKLVLNTTTGNLLYANGALATDTWKKTADGTVAQTPV